MIQCLHSSREIFNVILHNCLITSEAINLIRKIPLDTLKNLDLTGCDIDCESISEITSTIKNHQRLQVLKFTNNDFTAESVDELVQLTVSLKELKKLSGDSGDSIHSSI